MVSDSTNSIRWTQSAKFLGYSLWWGYSACTNITVSSSYLNKNQKWEKKTWSLWYCRSMLLQFCSSIAMTRWVCFRKLYLSFSMLDSSKQVYSYAWSFIINNYVFAFLDHKKTKTILLIQEYNCLQKKNQFLYVTLSLLCSWLIR